MKKFSFLLIFTLCFASLLGGTSFLTRTAYADVSADENPTITIEDEEQFKNYVEGYGQQNQNDKIILGGNIDFDKLNTTNEQGENMPFVLTKTIGTKEFPFQGTFDGNGYEIRNLRINIEQPEDAENAEKQKNKIENVGLFGYVSGAGTLNPETSTIEKAKIKNLSVSLKNSISVSGVEGANIGLLIGSAENAEISHIQLIPESVTMNFPTDCSVNFGLLAGTTKNCDISNVLCRTSSFGNWQFTGEEGKISYFGGVVGQVYNTKIAYTLVLETFSLSFRDYLGSMYFGGVAGLVSDGGTEMFNIGVENNYTFSNAPQNVYYGEVVGTVGVKPASGNINFIHYKQNDLPVFGKTNGYVVENSDITPTPNSLSLSSLRQDANGNYTYFEQQNWHRTQKYWDFDSVWYVNAYRIYLQNFITNFTVNFTGINTDVLEQVETEPVEPGYRYGDKATFKFKFKEIERAEDEKKEDMRKYYTLSYIELKDVQYRIKTTEDENGNVTAYSVASANNGNNLFDIQKTDDGFDFVIKSISNLTAGNYTIRVTAKQYTISFSTKFDEASAGELEGQTPGYIYYGSTKLEHFELNTLKFGDTYQIQTEAKPNQPYAFVGWFMNDGEGEKEIEINGQNILVRVLTLNFGSGDFTGNCEIYAKYTLNACKVLFNIDAGIYQVVCGGQTVEQSLMTDGIRLPKYESSLRLEIYVKEGFNFDVDEFIEEMTVYKTQAEGEFCVRSEDNITPEGYHRYLFILNMTILGDDYSDQFTINLKTASGNSGTGNMIWYIVGGVSGAVLIALLIVLIVLLVRRRNGGPRGGGKMKAPKLDKKAYKNMYF